MIKVTTRDPVELANQIETTMGDQPDVSIECSAVDFSFVTAIHVRHSIDYSLGSNTLYVACTCLVLTYGLDGEIFI